MISGVYLFELASKRAEWLGVRASTISGNIANANTPGFKAREVEPFDAVLSKTGGGLTATHAMHMGAETSASASVAKAKPDQTWETHVSGNSVVVEQELMKAAEVSRQHQMNVSIIRSFHKMMISSAKGGGSA